MAKIELQFSIVCEASDGLNIKNIINGFTPGIMKKFCIINKWIWDQDQLDEKINDKRLDPGGYYQETSIIEDGAEKRVIAFSRSDHFRVKNSHTHSNCFKNINFCQKYSYRVRIDLFDSNGKKVKNGSIEYPLFVERIK